VICQSNRFDDHCFVTSLTFFILYLIFELIQCRVSFSNKHPNLTGIVGFSRTKSQYLSWLMYLKYFGNVQNISCCLADPCYNCLLRCVEIGSWSTKICLHCFRFYITVLTINLLAPELFFKF